MSDNLFHDLLSLPFNQEDKPFLCLLGWHRLELRIKVWGERYELMSLCCNRCQSFYRLGPSDFPYDFFQTHQSIQTIIRTFLAEHKKKYGRKAF